MHNQHIDPVAAWIGVCAETSGVIYKILKCDLLTRADLPLRFVEMVNNVPNKMQEATFIEGLRKGLADDCVGLLAIHLRDRQVFGQNHFARTKVPDGAL